MDDVRVIRTVRFRARHHYGRREWSDDENRRVFGPQCEPHEHDWTVEVHVVGPVDTQTGWAVDLEALDAAVAAATRGWDGGDLNQALHAVADGGMQPSTEELARWLHAELSARVSPPARVVRVRVAESPDLASEYPA